MHSPKTSSSHPTHFHPESVPNWTVARCSDTQNFQNRWKCTSPSMQCLIAFTHPYPAISIISPPQPISFHHLRGTETLPVSLRDSAFACWARDNRRKKVVQICSLSRDEELEDHRMCFSIQFNYPCSSWKFLLDSGNSLIISTSSSQCKKFISISGFYEI